jgi:hypothetical protein
MRTHIVFIPALLLVTNLACSASSTDAADIGDIATEQQAATSDNAVAPVLFVPSDLTPNTLALPFIDRQMQLVQRWYGEAFSGVTFTLLPTVVIRGTQPLASYYSCTPTSKTCDPTQDLYARVESDLIRILGSNPLPANRAYGVFFQNNGKGAACLGGNPGMGVPGRMFLVGADSLLEDCNAPGCRAWGGNGGVAHELGHALGLGDGGDPWWTLMNTGFYSFPHSFFNDSQKSELLANGFLNQNSLLANGGFENACTTGWTVEYGQPGCVTGDPSEARIRSGGSTLRLGAGSHVVQETVAVQASKAYGLSGWLNVPAQPTSARLSVKLMAQSSSGSTLATATMADIGTSGTAGWTRFAKSLLMPTGTVKARIEISGAVTGEAFLDDFDFVADASAPPAPLPITYADKAQVATLQPTLAWSDAVKATSYRVQVSRYSSFSPTVVDTTVATPSYQVPSGLLSYNITYYWRVQASNLGGSSAWSRTSTVRPSSTTYGDEFQGGGLAPGWTKIREDGSHWRLDGAGQRLLIIDAMTGDLQTNNNAKNVMVRAAPSGNFEATTLVDMQSPWFWDSQGNPYLAAPSNTQRAGLIVYVDDNNYIQIGRVYSDGYALELITEINGTATVTRLYGTPQAVRITRVGSTYTAYYSNDSFNWIKLGSSVTQSTWTNARIGLAAYNPLAQQDYYEGHFDWLRVTSY